MSDKSAEWLKQAEYDMDTAVVMFNNGRYFYAVFMCHLSIEKALKGLYSHVHKQAPPKTHNLLYLLTQIGKRPSPELEKFITRLNTASVATRYPDDLAKNSGRLHSKSYAGIDGKKQRGVAMGQDAAIKTVRQFKKVLESANVQVEEMILYGSHATGTAREDSDIDLIVISPSFADKSYWERIDILSEAIYQLFVPIEASAFTPEEWETGQSLLVDYARNGVVVQ